MLSRYSTIVVILVLGKILLHLLVLFVEGYGVFRDELYYLANTDHPAWGYVDHPPLSIWLLDAWISVFGDSWRMIRVLSALLGGAAMWAVLRLVRTMGGNLVAIWLAGLAFLFAPINLAYSSYYSMNVIELVMWPLAMVLVINALRNPEDLWKWAGVGLVTGLGMMNKISMAWLAIGLIVFLLISPCRSLFTRKGPYLAGIVALLLFLPFVLWNLSHEMAHLEFAANASQYKYAGISRADFLTEQLLMEHPFIVIFLIGSLIYLLKPSIGWIQRFPVIVFFVTLSILLIKGQVKATYMAPAYAAVMASGAVWLSGATKGWQRGLLIVLAGLYVVSGLILLPLASPVLPEEDFVAYNSRLGIGPGNQESKEEGLLPQFFADMHGWENFARSISEAYLSVPETEREHIVAWVNNYGEAGAIDYYRDKYPLPPVLSRHNAYYHWGLEQLDQAEYSGILIVGGTREEHQAFLQKVEQIGMVSCTYCMPYENNLPVYYGKEPVADFDLIEIFRSEKNFN